MIDSKYEKSFSAMPEKLKSRFSIDRIKQFRRVRGNRGSPKIAFSQKEMDGTFSTISILSTNISRQTKFCTYCWLPHNLMTLGKINPLRTNNSIFPISFEKHSKMSGKLKVHSKDVLFKIMRSTKQ